MEAKYFASVIAVAVILTLIYFIDLFVLKKFEEREETKRNKIITGLLLFIIPFFIYYIFNNHKFIFYNNFSYFADALLHGKLSVPEMPAYLESVEFMNQRYMHFAPGPSLICIPFVALFGVAKFNAAWLCFILGAANTLLFYKVLENMGIGNKRERIWLAAFATMGTVHFFLAAIAHSWFFGHVTTLFFLLLAMYFLTKENAKRPALTMYLSGLFFGLAVTCRISTVAGIIFFAGYILLKKENKIKNLIFFGAGMVIPGVLYMLYNYVRFGTIMDIGYNLTFLKDKNRAEYDIMQALPAKEQLAYLYEMQDKFGGPLQLKYLKYNLYSIFLLMPDFKNESPYIIPTMKGISITLTSPALYFAVIAKWKDKLSWLLLVTTIITAIPFTLNYGNGMAQFGMRYSMDFTPYLLLLASMGLVPLRWYKRIVIMFSIFVSAWGPLFWNNFYIK